MSTYKPGASFHAQNSPPLFPLGHTAITPAALSAIEEAGEQPQAFLARHERGEWEGLTARDLQANFLAVQNGERVLSVFSTTKGVRVYVITEADRSVTTILLPVEY